MGQGKLHSVHSLHDILTSDLVSGPVYAFDHFKYLLDNDPEPERIIQILLTLGIGKCAITRKYGKILEQQDIDLDKWQ